MEHLLTIKKQDWQFLPQPKGVWVSLPKIDEWWELNGDYLDGFENKFKGE